MALWGTKDTVYSTGTVNVDVSTGVLTKNTGSINFTSGGVSVGDVVTVGVNTCEGIVQSVDSATQLTITKDKLGDADFSKVVYEIRQKPKSTLHDSNYGVGEIFGVDVTEQTVASAAGSQYSPAHAGWVGITSYTQTTNGVSVQRVKTEVLVASSSITADDASDDTILPNS